MKPGDILVPIPQYEKSFPDGTKLFVVAERRAGKVDEILCIVSGDIYTGVSAHWYPPNILYAWDVMP